MNHGNEGKATNQKLLTDVAPCYQNLTGPSGIALLTIRIQIYDKNGDLF